MKNLHKFFVLTIFLMGVTIFHHFYGSIIYPQVFRAYVAYASIGVVLLEYLIYRKYRNASSARQKIFYYFLFQTLTLFVPIISIGFFEGGYNHFLKNLLFFSHVKASILIQLFPPPSYEMPGNFLFEFTGILQFVIAIYALVFLLRHYKERNIAHRKELPNVGFNIN
jgi:hypothetical protein